jgi:hypothetical protein
MTNLRFRIFMQELGYVSHYGSLIRFVNVHIFGIQQSSDAKLTLGDVECVFEPLSVGLPLHLCQIDQIGLDGIDDGQERYTVSPRRAEVGHLNV